MALIQLGALYRALLEAHVSEELAQQAADEVARYQRRPETLPLAFLWLGAALVFVAGLIYLSKQF